MLGTATDRQQPPHIMTTIATKGTYCVLYIILFILYVDPLLSVQYELNPLNKPVDHSLNVSLRPVHVSYDASTVQRLIDMFHVPNNIRLQKTSSLAAVTLSQVKTQGRIGLQYAIEERKIIDINITICAPVLGIPLYGVMNGAQTVLVIDLGNLNISSDMKHHIPDVTVRKYTHT